MLTSFSESMRGSYWTQLLVPIFRPAQFAGHLTINRNSGTICQWNLSLPRRNSNVDIGAFRTADIAFCASHGTLQFIRDETKIDQIGKLLSPRKKLDRSFKAHSINSLKSSGPPIEDAVERAKASNRPIHAVLLFGVLDDESCLRGRAKV